MSSTKGGDRKSGEREIMGGAAYAVNRAGAHSRLRCTSGLRFIAAYRVCRRVPGVSSVLACVDGVWKPRLAQFSNPAMPVAASNRQDRVALNSGAGRSGKKGTHWLWHAGSPGAARSAPWLVL